MIIVSWKDASIAEDSMIISIHCILTVMFAHNYLILFV